MNNDQKQGFILSPCTQSKKEPLMGEGLLGFSAFPKTHHKPVLNPECVSLQDHRAPAREEEKIEHRTPQSLK